MFRFPRDLLDRLVGVSTAGRFFDGPAGFYEDKY